jgi:hypothetical protein
MFVRWQVYKSKAKEEWRRESKDKHARLKAILVESIRVNGKPRHKHIAYLGGIETGWDAIGLKALVDGLKALAERSPEDAEFYTERDLERRVQLYTERALERRVQFWSDVQYVLDRLHNRITPEERTSIEAAIAKRVARLSKAETEAWWRNQRRHWRKT